MMKFLFAAFTLSLTSYALPATAGNLSYSCNGSAVTLSSNGIFANVDGVKYRSSVAFTADVERYGYIIYLAEISGQPVAPLRYCFLTGR